MKAANKKQIKTIKVGEISETGDTTQGKAFRNHHQSRAARNLSQLRICLRKLSTKIFPFIHLHALHKGGEIEAQKTQVLFLALPLT